MSVHVSSLVWKTTLRTTDKIIMLKLADVANDDGSRVFPSVETIARECGCSDRTVQRTLKRFVDELGILEVVAFAKGGRGHATEYRVVLERVTNLHPLSGKGRQSDTLHVDVKGDTDATKGDTGDVKGDTDALKGDKACHPKRQEPSVTINISDGFQEFWKCWIEATAHPIGKRDAEAAFNDTYPDPMAVADLDRLKRAVPAYAKAKPGAIAFCNAATFIRKGRVEDYDDVTGSYQPSDAPVVNFAAGVDTDSPEASSWRLAAREFCRAKGVGAWNSWFGQCWLGPITDGGAVVFVPGRFKRDHMKTNGFDRLPVIGDLDLRLADSGDGAGDGAAAGASTDHDNQERAAV